MYVSRLSVHALPGKAREVEEEFKKLPLMVVKAGGVELKAIRTLVASQGAPEIVFEQETRDL